MKEDQSVIWQCSTDRPSSVTWKKVDIFFCEICAILTSDVKVLRHSMLSKLFNKIRAQN